MSHRPLTFSDINTALACRYGRERHIQLGVLTLLAGLLVAFFAWMRHEVDLHHLR